MSLTRNYATTLYNWLSGFAPTFRRPIQEGYFNEDNPQPNEYISYSAEAGNFNTAFIQAITIYSKSTSYNNVMQIVDEIESAIGESGCKVEGEWGFITIYKGSPFYQDKEDEDSSYRAGYINLEVRVYQYDV